MKDRIKQKYPDDTPVYLTGCDSAIIGYDSVSMRVIYSRSLLEDALVMLGSTVDEAAEHMQLILDKADEPKPIVADTLVFIDGDEHSNALINIIPIDAIDGQSRSSLL